MRPSSPSGTAEREALTGVVERVTFHNEQNGFCVLRVRVRGQREPVSVVGFLASVNPGETVHASGHWEIDVRHGRQFRAAHLRVTPPTSVEGIEKYLGSGMVRGIGPHFARRLVAAFGEQVFDVIENEPERLQGVEGIGPVRASRIRAAWEDQKAVREIMLFLHSHGVGTARAVRIYRTYGADAVALISENPYRLARDIRGIGFATADAIARKLGIEKTSPLRARAGIAYALLEAAGDGHCGLPVDELLALGARLLEIPRELVAAALEEELRGPDIVASEVAGVPHIFLAGLYHAERAIAQRLRELAARRPPWPPIDAAGAARWVEGELGLTLAPRQQEALHLATRSPVLVLTGGPGVGKTTLVNAIVRVLQGKGARVALCAPTGRAARRLAESTGVEAKTIHRLLEVDPSSGTFRRGPDRPIEADLLVVDECSMVDVPLMHATLSALPPHGALLLVGDVDQLPSVGPGQVLRDVIDSGAVPVVRLDHIFRQAARSQIVRNAHRINAGEMPNLSPEPDSDFYFVEAADPEQALSLLVRIVCERIPARFGLDPLRDVQVLCPMNRGGLGTRALNITLQQAINPQPPGSIERFGWRFGAGDKVMQVENDYDREVFNGDVGIIRSVDPEAGVLEIEFDGRRVAYDADDLDGLVLAYAASIHKSQGSEYPAVVVPVTTQHYPMLQRNLLYTGVTRGRRLVVLIGQPKAVAIAVRQAERTARHTRLREWLASGG